MSQAPRHSKPLTKMLAVGAHGAAVAGRVAVGAGGLADGVEQLVGAAHPAGDVGADQDPVLAGGLHVEEVVEAGDRLELGRLEVHDRGRLLHALGRAPAVTALDRGQRRDDRRALVGVEAHQALDLGAQLIGHAAPAVAPAARPRPTRRSVVAAAPRELTSSAACSSPGGVPASGTGGSPLSPGRRVLGRSPTPGLAAVRRSLLSDGARLPRPRCAPTFLVERLVLRSALLAHRSMPPRIGSSIARLQIRSAT